MTTRATNPATRSLLIVVAALLPGAPRSAAQAPPVRAAATPPAPSSSLAGPAAESWPPARLPPTRNTPFHEGPAAAPGSVVPPGARTGVFQRIGFQGAYLPRLEGDSLGVSSLGTDIVFGFPFPDRRSPLLLTPRYRLLLLDGPDFVDIPPRLHEASIGLSHFRKLSDRWTLNGGVDLGVFADDDRFGDEGSFFVTGRMLGIKQLTGTWKGIIGAVYVNRAGLSIFPALGLMYEGERRQLDLIFPRPRVAWLLPGSTPQPGDQRWLYLQGEFGGGRYAVRREGGADDTLSLGDFRVAIGHERKVIGGLSRKWELGYVFGRELEFDSDGADRSLDDTLMLRSLLTY